MRTQISLFFFVSAVVLLACSSSAALVGGWTRIKDPSDSVIQNIARFAIDEHNKAASPQEPKLSYHSVVSGETQVVAGMNYRLQIEAKDPSGFIRHCEAVVWEKPWQSFRRLMSFSINK